MAHSQLQALEIGKLPKRFTEARVQEGLDFLLKILKVIDSRPEKLPWLEALMIGREDV